MSDHIEKPQGPSPRSLRRALAADLVQALRFYSRLPLPALPWEPNPHGVPDFQRLARVLPLPGAGLGLPSAPAPGGVPGVRRRARGLPLAGAVLGLPSALAMGAALALGLGPWLAATLSV